MAIYKLTNKITEMSYIGQTTNPNPKIRIKAHFNPKYSGCPYLKHAILKYGKDNFSIKILHNSIDVNELNILEQQFIQSENTLFPNGYNLKMGGSQGGACTELTKKKISEKNKGHTYLRGKPKTLEHRAAMSKERKGKKQTEARASVLQKVHENSGYAIVATKGDISITFNSIEACARELNLVSSCISRVLRNDQNRKQHNGWKFVYITKGEK